MPNDLSINEYGQIGTHQIVCGRRLWVTDVGSGPPVVFLHGNPSFSFSFRYQVAAFADRYRVIVPDLLGFGSSEMQCDDSTFTDHAERFEVLLDSLDLQDVHLVLHDWGGPIGLRWAVRNPNRIAKLVLSNTTVTSKITPPFWWSVFTAPGIGELSVVWTRLFVDRATRMRVRKDPSACQYYRKAFRKAAQRCSLLSLERLENLEEVMCEIESKWGFLGSIPCLLLWGEPELYFLDGLGRLQDALADAQTVTVPDGGHFLFETSPHAVNQTLDRFFDENRRP